VAVTDHESLHNTIRSRFNSLVTGPRSLPTIFDNEGEQQDTSVIYCRLAILNTDSEQQDMGGGSTQRERTIGLMVAELYGPVERGDGNLLQEADFIKSQFRRTTADGVTWRTPKVRTIGRDGESWQINVTCPFYADVIS
jgi:hypothetical protein